MDPTSILNRLNEIQKQFSTITSSVTTTTSEKHRQDKITTGPTSTVSSTSDEVLDFQDDDNLSHLTTVVDDASLHAAYCTCTRHLSSVWIQKLDNPFAKNLLSSDSLDVNVLSCISRLLLHFYPRIDTDERGHVDETRGDRRAHIGCLC